VSTFKLVSSSPTLYGYATLRNDAHDTKLQKNVAVLELFFSFSWPNQFSQEHIANCRFGGSLQHVPDRRLMLSDAPTDPKNLW